MGLHLGFLFNMLHLQFETFDVIAHLEFFLRIVVAGICGAIVGVERSKRFKEAGIRTHVIICASAALMMIVSKYGFIDLGNSGIGDRHIDVLWGIWTLKSIILPFNKLAEYPERLSKGQMTEKLPERRGGFFGRYIWGMNMLSDKLESDRSTIRRLSLERERFITSLIHGIKTPAANIKLLSEAISTGLYDPEGRINEKDAELAGRIEKNADEIEQLVTKVMESTTNEIFDYDPQKEPFYRSRLEKFIRDEYTTRLNMTRTPLDIVSEGDLMINSDYDGICRIIRQVMDNAIKSGDGTGINVKMEKTAEGHFVTISNNGEPLPETELPFVWGSMWRGSNAQNIKGSGVGLYESRLIARKLGGDLLMRAGDHSTEVTLFLPLKM